VVGQMAPFCKATPGQALLDLQFTMTFSSNLLSSFVDSYVLVYQTYQVSCIIVPPSVPPHALTLALTKTGYISRICHSIVQTKLCGQQYLCIVLPIVTAERIRGSGRLLVQNQVAPPFDLGRRGPCAQYAALALLTYTWTMASESVESPPSPKRFRLSGAATYGTNFNLEWTAQFPFISKRASRSGVQLLLPKLSPSGYCRC